MSMCSNDIFIWRLLLCSNMKVKIVVIKGLLMVTHITCEPLRAILLVGPSVLFSSLKQGPLWQKVLKITFVYAAFYLGPNTPCLGSPELI